MAATALIYEALFSNDLQMGRRRPHHACRYLVPLLACQSCMRDRKSWLGMRTRPAHASGGGASDATARAMALTAELGPRFGAGGLALCKPRLDAAALVAASDSE